jgi:serine/threonine protein kinase
MQLSPGTKLAHYEVLEPIGKGGMGEVYRARDTKLERDVAIKVLPEEFAKDKERLARFEREAKLLASLNHPNIASIYGLEESDGVKALVLELVEGPTLAERIAGISSPYPVARDRLMLDFVENEESYERARPTDVSLRRRSAGLRAW